MLSPELAQAQEAAQERLADALEAEQQSQSLTSPERALATMQRLTAEHEAAQIAQAVRIDELAQAVEGEIDAAATEATRAKERRREYRDLYLAAYGRRHEIGEGYAFESIVPEGVSNLYAAAYFAVAVAKEMRARPTIPVSELMRIAALTVSDKFAGRR